MSLDVLAILTRTHNRRQKFEACRKSVLALRQYINVRHVVGIDCVNDYAEGDILVPCFKEDIPIPAPYRFSRKAPYNTYIHQLIHAAGKGWGLILDDDDVLLAENFPSLLPLMHSPALIIAKYDDGEKLLPKTFPAEHGVPVCCGLFPVEAALDIKVPGVYGGDAYFFSCLAKKLEVRMSDVVIAKSQGSYGFGIGDILYSIIIPQYNNTALTLNLLRDINNLHGAQDLEVLVIDNGSKVKVNFPNSFRFRLQLIRRKQNDSIYKSWNVGAAAAKGEWLVFLNNDVRIKDPNFLKELCIMPDALLSCGYYERNVKLTSDGIYEAKPPGIRPDGFAGFAFALHRELFERLGKFDEAFRIWYGDNEYYERAKQQGVKCLIVGSACVHHALNSTLKKIPYIDKIIERDRRLWHAKSTQSAGGTH